MARFSPLLGHPSFAAAVAGAGAGGPGGLSPGAPGSQHNGGAVPGGGGGPPGHGGAGGSVLNPSHLPHLKSDPYGSDHPLAGGHHHHMSHHQGRIIHHDKESPSKCPSKDRTL